MLSQATLRASAARTMAARRAFHATPARMASPYHYPEGPRSNIPFNPLTRFFYIRYWGFVGNYPYIGARPKLLTNAISNGLRLAILDSLLAASQERLKAIGAGRKLDGEGMADSAD